MPRLCPDGKLQRAVELFDVDPTEGLEALDVLADKYQKDPRVRSVTGIAYLDVGEAWLALPHLEWAVGKEPEPDRLEALRNAYLELDMPLHAANADARLGLHGTEVDPNHAVTDVTDAGKPLTHKDQLEFERGRMELVRDGGAAVHRFQPLAKKYPDFPTAQNLLTTANWAVGDLERFRTSAKTALERWPDNLHALLNGARLALLDQGWEGARALKDRVIAASVGTNRADDLLARSQALSYMNDPEALRASLAEYLALLGDDVPIPVAAQGLMVLLEERAFDEGAPVVRLLPLLAGLFNRWKASAHGPTLEQAAQEFRQMPGLLAVLPELLGYSERPLAEFMTAVLLGENAPPADSAPWPDVLSEVALRGPGYRATRGAMLAGLAARGLIDDGDARLTFEDTSGREIELLFGNPEQGVPEEVEEVFLEGLLTSQPRRLVFRAQVALDALAADDIARAEEVLVLPEAESTFQVDEYAAFLAAQCSVALASGEVERAVAIHDLLAEVVGEEDEVWQELDQEIDEAFEDEPGDEPLFDEYDDEDLVKRDALYDSLVNDRASRVPEDLLALPVLDEVWQVAAGPGAFVSDGLGGADLVYTAVVTTADGRVRYGTTIEDAFEGDSLFQVVAAACYPIEETFDEGRPRAILVGSERLAGPLRRRLEAVGMAVEVGDDQIARELHTRLVGALHPDAAEPYLASEPPAQVDSFIDTAQRFFDARPWRVFDADRYLAFRVGDGPWRYANVMGQGGEEFGLGLYDDWRSLQRIVDSSTASAYDDAYEDDDVSSPPGLALDEIGGIENLTLGPLTLLSPAEAGCYAERGARTFHGGDYPLLLRITAQGRARPSLPLPVYTGLMALLVLEIERAKGRVADFETEMGTSDGLLRVRYPASGLE